MVYQRIEFRQAGWLGTVRLVLGAAIALGLVVALLILALGVAIILLPVIAVASLIGWFRWRKTVAVVREAAARRDDGGRVIEVDYDVVGGNSGRR